MRKRTLREKFYTGCGYSIFGALVFAFFLGLSVAYGIKTASIIVGAIVTVFWLILIAIYLSWSFATVKIQVAAVQSHSQNPMIALCQSLMVLTRNYHLTKEVEVWD